MTTCNSYLSDILDRSFSPPGNPSVHSYLAVDLYNNLSEVGSTLGEMGYSRNASLPTMKAHGEV